MDEPLELRGPLGARDGEGLAAEELGVVDADLGRKDVGGEVGDGALVVEEGQPRDRVLDVGAVEEVGGDVAGCGGGHGWDAEGG